ncbi:MAG: hypothetical protein IJV61_04490 [Paludibacteraceae bacterium]|nr:hypothetical protein [Paludibacteraceae bacterium]
MFTFFELWSLLEPKTEYANLINHCKQLWSSWTPEKQEEVFLKIEKKKTEHKFVDYNPLLALRNNAFERQTRKQTLTFAEYYARFGTTAEQDGWRMINPTGQQVLFVK